MKKLILVLAILFMLPLSVNADSIILSCPSQVEKNADFTCELSGNTDTSVSALSARLLLSDNLSLTSFIPRNVWKGDGANGRIELYTADIQNGTFQIGTIKLKNTSSSDITITVNSIFFYDANDEEKSISNVSKTIKVNSDNNKPTNEPSATSKPSSSNNESNNETKTDEVLDNTTSSYYLTDIQIAGYNLDFVKEITEYTLRIKDENSLNITPVLEDKDASYEILGNNNLKNNSVIRIQVTSTDNNIQTYRITIEKDEVVNKKNYTQVFIVIIVLLILVNIARIIINEKKKIGGEER